MLNDGWDEDLTTAESDAAAEEMHRDAHPCCLECEQPGCLPDECPSGACDIEALVTCHGELVHGRCVVAFERHIENRCNGTTCNCPAAPEMVDADPTCKTVVEPYETIASVAARRLALVAGLLLALGLGGACRATVTPPQVETVGALAAGPSVYSAPVHDTTPPPSFEIAGPADDDATGTATTTTRVDVDAGAPDGEAPDVVAKEAHGF